VSRVKRGRALGPRARSRFQPLDIGTLNPRSAIGSGDREEHELLDSKWIASEVPSHEDGLKACFFFFFFDMCNSFSINTVTIFFFFFFFFFLEWKTPWRLVFDF
jgi:hypothetical protein